MNWYISKLVFNISTEDSQQSKKQFDEQIRLIEANSSEEAFLKARAMGLNEEEFFLNDKKSLVRWEFINVAELIPLKKLENGAELYSQTHETDEAKSYINIVHQKAIALRLKTMPMF